MTPDQSGRHHARATAGSCLSVGIIRPVSVLYPVADHASFLPIASLRQGKASVWLIPRSPLHPSLRSDADLLWPLSALTLATGQVFTGTHAPKNVRQ